MTDNQALTRDEMLRYFDQAAEELLDGVGKKCDEAEIPPECYDLAYAGASLNLSGTRLALSRWMPKPPITDPTEKAACLRTIREEADSSVSAAVRELADKRLKFVWHALSARGNDITGFDASYSGTFTTFDRTRRTRTEDRMTHDQYVAIYGLNSEMDGVEKVYQPDGKYKLVEKSKKESQQ